jgi:hypothetical protein
MVDGTSTLSTTCSLDGGDLAVVRPSDQENDEQCDDSQGGNDNGDQRGRVGISAQGVGDIDDLARVALMDPLMDDDTDVDHWTRPDSL